MANAYSSNGPADRSYVKKAMKAPMLEAEHELELARRWREQEDDKKAGADTRQHAVCERLTPDEACDQMPRQDDHRQP